MNPAERFLKECNGVYKGVEVYACIDEINRWAINSFPDSDIAEDIVFIKPLDSTKDIGAGAGCSIELTFPKYGKIK